METSGINAQTSRDEFLQLLVTQLRHQDPLEPVKQEDFLSQLAQFSTLEGIETLNSNFEQQLAVQQDLVQMQQFTQSSSLIGKEVTFESESTDSNKQGIVEGVVVTRDGLRLRVADDLIAIDQIKSLTEASPEDLAVDRSSTDSQPTILPPTKLDLQPEIDVPAENDVPVSDNPIPSVEPTLFPRTLLKTAPTSHSLK